MKTQYFVIKPIQEKKIHKLSFFNKEEREEQSNELYTMILLDDKKICNLLP